MVCGCRNAVDMYWHALGFFKGGETFSINQLGCTVSLGQTDVKVFLTNAVCSVENRSWLERNFC